jgi:hypothetical protein
MLQPLGLEPLTISILPADTSKFNGQRCTNMQLTDGFRVPGNIKIEGHEFVTTMSGAQLLRITKDPRDSEDPKLRSSDRQLEGLFRIRQEVQRMFQGAKEKNVESYAKYIVALEDGAHGVTPQIVLFTPTDLTVQPNDQGWYGDLFLPWDVELVAIDGETQLAARFEAAKILAETKKQESGCQDLLQPHARMGQASLPRSQSALGSAERRHRHRHGYARPADFYHTGSGAVAVLSRPCFGVTATQEERQGHLHVVGTADRCGLFQRRHCRIAVRKQIGAGQRATRSSCQAGGT